MRALAGVILGLCISFSSFAQQEDDASAVTPTHFISDNVFIFIHAGPGRNFRILGSVSAGMPVARTDSSVTGEFVEIIDPQGRTGWIEEQYLVVKPSFRELVPDLQDQLAEAQANVLPLRQRISELNSTINEQQAQLKTLETDLSNANNTIARLEAQKDDEAQAMQIQWLMYGGGLAVGCIILGILLTYIPKKRKRNDGWMN